MARTRIQWSYDERKILKEKIISLMVTPGFERGEFVHLLKKAQTILPPERRRKDITLTSERKFMEECLQSYKCGQSFTTHEAEQASPAVPAASTPPHPADILLEWLVEAVAAKVAEKLLSRIKVSPEEKEEVKPKPPVTSQPTPRKPKILLVGGTLGEERTKLHMEYDQFFNLKFFDDKSGAYGLREAATHCDHVILRTAVCRHSHLNALRAANIAFIPVEGQSLNKICQVLDDIYLTSQGIAKCKQSPSTQS